MLVMVVFGLLAFQYTLNSHFRRIFLINLDNGTADSSSPTGATKAWVGDYCIGSDNWHLWGGRGGLSWQKLWNLYQVLVPVFTQSPLPLPNTIVKNLACGRH